MTIFNSKLLVYQRVCVISCAAWMVEAEAAIRMFDVQKAWRLPLFNPPSFETEIRTQTWMIHFGGRPIAETWEHRYQNWISEKIGWIWLIFDAAFFLSHICKSWSKQSTSYQVVTHQHSQITHYLYMESSAPTPILLGPASTTVCANSLVCLRALRTHRLITVGSRIFSRDPMVKICQSHPCNAVKSLVGFHGISWLYIIIRDVGSTFLIDIHQPCRVDIYCNRIHIIDPPNSSEYPLDSTSVTQRPRWTPSSQPSPGNVAQGPGCCFLPPRKDWTYQKYLGNWCPIFPNFPVAD